MSYNSCSAPCFAGGCLVEMADGTTKRVEAVRKGDVVVSSTASGADMVASVACVLKTVCAAGKKALVTLPHGGLRVTEWHPVRNPETRAWAFPADLGTASVVECEAVYSFLLQDERDEAAVSMRIDGTDCITLAHGIEDDKVAAHAFFGTQCVREALAELVGFDAGLVVLHEHGGCVSRDAGTGLVCGLVQQPQQAD